MSISIPSSAGAMSVVWRWLWSVEDLLEEFLPSCCLVNFARDDVSFLVLCRSTSPSPETSLQCLFNLLKGLQVVPSGCLLRLICQSLHVQFLVPLGLRLNLLLHFRVCSPQYVDFLIDLFPLVDRLPHAKL